MYMMDEYIVSSFIVGLINRETIARSRMNQFPNLCKLHCWIIDFQLRFQMWLIFLETDQDNGKRKVGLPQEVAPGHTTRQS